MAVTEQDARALAFLASRLRAETPKANHWDRAGIEKVVDKLIGRDLANACERVVRHSIDPEARTPAAILRPFTPAAPESEAPRPPKSEESCRLCGRHATNCTCPEGPTRRPPIPAAPEARCTAAARARDLIRTATSQEDR